MRTALITTTIRIPFVLALYRRYGSDVAFFVAGDTRQPAGSIEFCDSINATFLEFDDQYRRYPILSELVGERCIQRRNFALLEAVKWGADVIVSVDDDNIPLSPNYFGVFESVLTHPFNGLLAFSSSGWFDVGMLLHPVAPHRGFPHARHPAIPVFDSITDARIGVAAGICLGDPDIGACERIANAPTVHSVSELLRTGVVTDPRHTMTVFNSQNTAFLRELSPAFFMFPACGRYDDIYASLVMQRVMRERNLHVHFGQPFVWQQRNSHDLVKDLRAEIDGMQNVERFAAVLDATNLSGVATVCNQVRAILHNLKNEPWFPRQAIDAALAFQDDIEKIL